MGITNESIGHYDVLRRIGSGGMGEVYVARDPKLGRNVAIKLLPDRLISDRDTLARFTQEARSASALNHPNIVTIHEVGATATGVPFIVMEYVDGRDLRMLLHDGPPTVRKILDIAVQIADGLAAAHERGIVHRDLKPENIMVTKDGFVKILDFGLAKMVGPSSEGDETQLLEVPATNPGTILGTVGYMSPEQATGRLLDFRSDQFAFGAILYELATGKPAFGGENAIDVLSGVLHLDPPPVTRANPRIPVQLADIIHRLLEKSPDERYASPRDLARELHLLRERVVAEESGFHKSQPAPGPRKSTVAIMAAIALAVFIAGVVYVTRERTAGTATSVTAPAASKYLAVMRFKDLTGDENGRLVLDGFGETLTTRLAHFPSVQVMRPPVSDTEPSDPLVAARELGANLVLTGSMMRSGDRIRVNYSVRDIKTGREWRDLVEGTVSDLFGVQDEVAAGVARNLGLGATQAARVALDPSVSQRRYLEALGYLQRYDSKESVDSAIAILQDLGASPSVQAALARAYLYEFQITRQPELAAQAAQAADRALKGDPQSADVNVTLGELYRRTGRFPEAIAAFLHVLSQQPNNADAVLGLAEAYKGADDLKNAEATYKRAIALQPNYWGGYNKLGAFYFVQGRIDDAIPMFQKVVQLVPDNQRGYNNLGAMYQRVGRYDDAIRVFTESIRRSPTAQGYSNLGTSYYFLGRYRESAEAFEKAVALAPDDFLYRRNLGDAYRWVPGDEGKSREAYRRAIVLCDKAIEVNPAEVYAYVAKAGSLAKLGHDVEARNAILRALELEPRNAVVVYEAAVVSNVGGSKDETVARLSQALRLGFTIQDLENDPEFENLRKSGTLQQIIRNYGSAKSTK